MSNDKLDVENARKSRFWATCCAKNAGVGEDALSSDVVISRCRVFEYGKKKQDTK